MARAVPTEAIGPARLRVQPVEAPLTPEAAAREGARCLDCRVTVLSELDDEAQRCALCGRCVDHCPAGALWFEAVEPGTALRYDAERCLRCGLCVERCPAGCLRTGALEPRAAERHG